MRVRPHYLSLARAHGQCRTALFAAAARGSDKTVVVLLAAKADPNLCNPKVRLRAMLVWTRARAWRRALLCRHVGSLNAEPLVLSDSLITIRR